MTWSSIEMLPISGNGMGPPATLHVPGREEPISMTASTCKSSEGGREAVRYWRIRTRLEFVRLGLWGVLRTMWEVIHHS